MNETSLKQRTITALIWSFIDKFGQQIIYLLSGIILARIVDVADFGLVAKLAIFTALSNLLIESGLGGALIKKQNVTDRDYVSVFYFNIGVSIIFYIILFFAAPAISAFYDEPQLTTLSRVLFLAIIFNAFSFIQSNIFVKHIKFQVLARINVTALLASSVVSILLAMYGFGVWALISQTLCLAFFRSLFLWILSSWRPNVRFSVEPLKEFFSFSSKVLLTGTLNTFFNNIYTVIIGKCFNTVQLGYYYQANKYQEIPNALISNTFRTVTLPVFSDVNTDEERLKRVLRKTQKTIAFISFPIYLGLIVVARPLIVVLIKEKWLPAVDFLQLLLLAALFTTLSAVYNELMLAKGRSGMYLRLEIIKKAFLVIGIVISIGFGVKALVAAWVVYALFSFVLSAVVAGKIVSYSLTELLKDITPYAIIALLMSALTYLFSYLPLNNILLLLIQATFGGIFYIVMCKVFKLEIWQETLSYFNRFRIKKK